MGTPDIMNRLLPPADGANVQASNSRCQSDRLTQRAAHSGSAAGDFTIAIMQPYFIPYAGYFRLFSACDLFVIYDCVQFPRRGWVHRNRVIDSSGVERWLTLPLRKSPQNVLIGDLRFPANAPALLAERLRPLGLRSEYEDVSGILAALSDIRDTPVDYIEKLLKRVAVYLGLRWNVIRSSSLQISSELRGQDRILEIARRLGARHYVNAPGGRALYDPQRFADNGIELCFLNDYPGSRISILNRLLAEARDRLAMDIGAAAL
jgi:hypothetical protein